ncbi:MAG: hypothetical protein GY759_03590 [Chloroflexi bacterium]|nr:hypothetical protein [Chloroflexota bacterium]
MREFERIAMARLFIAQGHYDSALELLGSLAQSSQQQGRNGNLIEILVLEALAYQGKGNITNALRSLQRGLQLAESEGYVRVFVDEGAPMSDMLAEIGARGEGGAYVNRLLSAMGAHASRTALDSGQDVHLLAESLSEREMEVLDLIAQGLSNRDIANALYVALSTVKTHINHIYRKLDVTSRTQAMVRAQNLHLL